METVIWILIFVFYLCSFSNSTTYKFQETKVPCHPCHVHISYGNSISDVTVIWATEQRCNSTLSYGTDPWKSQQADNVEMSHFENGMSVDGLTCIYRVQLKNLQPDTTYFYRPVSDNISAGPFFFRTPSEEKNLSPEFMICGDHGSDIDRLPYLDHEILTGNYDAILHVGEFSKGSVIDDKVESEENDTEVCFPRSGDLFMSLISNMASRVPHLTTPGFHVSGDLFSEYRNWFSTPNTQWPIPLNKMWYSFDIGPVHFISYSTEVYFLDNQQYANEQSDWLVQDLISVSMNRTAHPWIVAFGHRAMYCSDTSEDCSKPDSKVRLGLENTFFTYGVDLVIQAHGSSYERLYPHYQGQLLGSDYTNPKAPIQIITGTAGLDGDTSASFAQQPWSALRLGEKGANSFTKLKVYNNTHLYLEQISTKDKSVLDSIWVVTSHHEAFIAPVPPPKPTEPSKPKVDVEGSDDPNKATDTSSAAGSSNIISGNTDTFTDFFDDTSNRVLLGVGVGVVTLALLVSIVIIVKKKQRIRSYKRWDSAVDYGRKFYSSYSQVGKDDKEGSDFEVDSSEGNAASKLLSDK